MPHEDGAACAYPRRSQSMTANCDEQPRCLIAIRRVDLGADIAHRLASRRNPLARLARHPRSLRVRRSIYRRQGPIARHPPRAVVLDPPAAAIALRPDRGPLRQLPARHRRARDGHGRAAGALRQLGHVGCVVRRRTGRDRGRWLGPRSTGVVDAAHRRARAQAVVDVVACTLVTPSSR